MAVPFPEVDIKNQYVKFFGGLDLESDVRSISSGALQDGMNYQPGLFGGYERIEGFERYDGRVNPSDATYYYATYTYSAAVLVGQSVTGTTSGAVGVVSQISTTAISLTKVSGTFVNGETFKKDAGGPGGLPLLLTMTYGAATVVGTFTMTPTLRGYDGAENDAIALNAAADIYRADVGPVPGESQIMGLWMLAGSLYAFRYAGVVNGVDTAYIWKASDAGWVKIDTAEEISFTTGTDNVRDGDTLTQGAATATIARVVQTTSATSPSRVGRLILTGRTGNFYNGPATTSSGGVLTLSGASSAIALPSASRMSFDNYNFSGSEGTMRMYGAWGVNGSRGFEFDGTTYVPITTGMTTDTPKFVKGHKNQLFLSFAGSSQNSGVGLPYVWTTVTGANEIGVGDSITGYSTMPGEALAIASRDSLRQLNGSTISDFQLQNISDRRGAIPYTVQEMGQTYCLDDQGIVRITATQNYGNFHESIVSRKIQPLIDSFRTVGVPYIISTVFRARNQYRLYNCLTGEGIIMSITNGEKGAVAQFTEFNYNSGLSSTVFKPWCICAGEDSTGKDVVFWADFSSGYVYQCDKGTSFDGYDIESYLRMPYGDDKSPEVIKRYRGVALEMKADGFTNIRFHPDFSYGDPAIATHQLQTKDVVGRGAFWGSSAAIWSSFFYDAQLVSTPRFPINGSGVNLSLLLYSKSDYYASHTLSGATIRYTPRRLRPN